MENWKACQYDGAGPWFVKTGDGPEVIIASKAGAKYLVSEHNALRALLEQWEAKSNVIITPHGSFTLDNRDGYFAEQLVAAHNATLPTEKVEAKRWALIHFVGQDWCVVDSSDPLNIVCAGLIHEQAIVIRNRHNSECDRLAGKGGE